ncbi:NGG1p interacting factor NIF3 [Thermanaerosceptrum fracticalcis]|uniref:NGG1p interacting factor NIF3 n=1 Tax=Thermanaerosceptrum fracticalcis TaxID=1712410 RepID=A0A7G6DZL7_THEFR|nr:NGG1p interacting factor 3 protein, NIF3 [Thermanaerosceptrum fracticalcis]QNB45271.1 NGG1p interacting factor NIF3 [Thermanaerosceptrum fracticalcis]
MKIREIYQFFVKRGIENDPRSKDEIERELKQAEETYKETKETDKEFFDQERLTNPYSDTRILYGNPELEVKKVLVGIDVEISEILLADRLRERGESVDLIIAHHPEGKALVALHKVMTMQEDILAHLGVPVNIAEGLMGSRISEVERGLMPLNHNRSVDAARLLGIPFMCVHTPADNMVNTFLTKLFEEKNPCTLGEIIKILREIPEYKEAAKIGAGPKIVVGSEKKRAGKIFVDMTGGTGGSEDAYAKLAGAGVGTIVGMHIGEKHRKEAEKNHINVIIAGHMASDSLGMNLLLDSLAEQGVSILPCSGLIRVKR